MDRKKLLILIIVSVLCCTGIKLAASVLGMIIGGKVIAALVLSGLAAVLIVKKKRSCYVFPLVQLGMNLLSDISAVRKCMGYLNGTASVYDLFDGELQKLVEQLQSYIPDGLVIGAAAAVGIYEVLNTLGMFLLVLAAAVIARYVIAKKENNINKNGGKEHDQAYT